MQSSPTSKFANEINRTFEKNCKTNESLKTVKSQESGNTTKP